jgi:hypothetical protein
MEVSGQLYAPAALPQGNSPSYPMDRRLGGAQSRYGRGGEEKNSPPLLRLEPPIFQSVAQRYATELFCLLNLVSVIIALGYELDDRGSRVRFPAGAGNFSLHHRVQNGSVAHLASYPMGTRGCFLGSSGRGVKLTTHLHLVPKSMSGAIHPLPQYTFMEWCLVKAQG